MEHSRIICRVCLKQFSKYTCPRCNCTYCSLPCFKEHSHACTESFYRDQAVVQLKGTRAGEDERRKVQQILRSFHAQLSDDEQELLQQRSIQQGGGHGGGGGIEEGGAGEYEQGQDEAEGEERGDALLSQETLAKLLQQIERAVDAAQPTSAAELELLMEQLELDEADLTPQETKNLQRAAATGSLSHLLQPWHPWWLSPEAKELRLGASGLPLVLECRQGPGGQQQLQQEGEARSSAAAQASASAALPRPPRKPLPALTSLSRSPPSPLLRWHVLELLYAYCFVMRMFNGEVHGGGAAGLELEAASLALELSAVLSSSASGPASPPPPPEQAAESGATSGTQDEGMPRLATEAVLGCLSRTCQPPVGDSFSRPLAVATLGDVVGLIGAGRSAVILALSDLQEIMEEAAEQVRCMEASTGRGAASGGPGLWARGRATAAAAAKPLKERRAALKAAARKLHFFCCWANEQNEAALSSVQATLEAEWQQHQATLTSSKGRSPGSIDTVSEQRQQQQRQLGGESLVQELQ